MKSLRSYSDEMLVRHYIAGREECLNILVERHRDKIFSYIHMHVRCREEVEDIFQDVVIKVCLCLREGRYNESGKFVPWVIRIAHNLIVDRVRRNRQNRLVYGEDNPLELFVDNEELMDVSQENRIEEQQRMADLVSMLNLLPECQRRVIEMRHYADMSFREIAEETDVSINTALGRMRYGLNNLRRMIACNNRVCV